MTHSDLIALLQRHPRCCERFRWSIDYSLETGQPITAQDQRGVVITTDHEDWDGPPAGLQAIVGPLVLWCWERRIEAIHALGTWQAFSMDDGTEALSGEHPEPWLALLDACEHHQD